MRPWQKDAIKLFREVRNHTRQTGNRSLHRACATAIRLMIAEGGCVPSDLRQYAAEICGPNEVWSLASGSINPVEPVLPACFKLPN
jgi:hypothetical protein